MDTKELINKINNVKESKSIYIEEIDAYAVNANGYKGIAINNNNNVVIKENFNKVLLQNGILDLEGNNKNAIALVTEDNMMSVEYGVLCLDFVDLNRRKEIMADPYNAFYEKWKNLIGNTVLGKTVYDVLGEMKTIEMLQMKGENPSWDSMKKGTFDISCNNGLYEVKTTKQRTESIITIHSQFQLDQSTINSKLYISFVRVEESNAGESIEDLSKKIVANGFDKIELEEYLDSIGLYRGKAERNKKYIIHEIRFYPVDEKFPKITKNSFKNDEIPQGVVKYEYIVSLDGLVNEKII